MVHDLLMCAVIMTVTFAITLIWLRFADPLRAGRAASPRTLTRLCELFSVVAHALSVTHVPIAHAVADCPASVLSIFPALSRALAMGLRVAPFWSWHSDASDRAWHEPGSLLPLRFFTNNQQLWWRANSHTNALAR